MSLACSLAGTGGGGEEQINTKIFLLPENDIPQAVEHFSSLQITSTIPIDPQVANWLLWSTNLISKLKNRVSNPSRLPLPQELQVLMGLQRDLKAQFTSENNDDPNQLQKTRDLSDDECQLQRLWIGFYGKEEPYSRFSKKWKRLGFQHGIDPVSDFRGCGMLPLHCLVYIFEEQPIVARHLYANREIRLGKRGEFANYPFACAGITLVKILCGLLKICNSATGNIIDEFNSSYASYWQIVSSRKHFNELFVWSLLVLDNAWDEMEATYMDFGNVIKVTSQRITDALTQLEGNEIPSIQCLNLT